MKNTKKRGKFTLFVYREKPSYYIGVCLEFGLIHEGRTPEGTLENIKNAAFGYLATVWKEGYEDYLLNQSAPGIYWRKYYEHLKRRERTAKLLQKTKDNGKSGSDLIKWNEWAKPSLIQEFPYTRNKVTL